MRPDDFPPDGIIRRRKGQQPLPELPATGAACLPDQRRARVKVAGGRRLRIVGGLRARR